MIANASSLVGTTAVTSAFGVLYWWVAAHRFTSEAVGLAAASIAAMTLLGNLSMVGLGTLLIGELPRRTDTRAALISTALAVAGAVGLVLGACFAVIAPWASASFRPLLSSIQHVLLFTLGVGLTAVALVLDQALIGLLRGKEQFWRNTIFAVTKLFALVLAGIWWSGGSGLTIYATWAIGTLFSLGIPAMFVLMRATALRPYRPQWRTLRGAGRMAGGHHALNLALQMSGLLMPLLVTTLLSATKNAHFYIAWMMAGFVFVGPLAFSTVLYAVGVASPDALAGKIRFTLGLATVIGVLANVVLLLGADRLLGLFGASYAPDAGSSLRIMALIVFPLIVKDLYVTLGRIQGRLGSTAILIAIGSVLELALAALGALLGDLPGLSLGLLAAVCIEALFGGRVVFNAARGSRTLFLQTPRDSVVGQ